MNKITQILFFILTINLSTQSIALGTLSSQESSRYQITDILEPQEVNDTQRVVKTLSDKVLSEYVKGYARRNVHAKANGCVKSEFKINNNLKNTTLAKGIFKPGASYKALIRFSNGSTNGSGDDRDGDTRGMAIKVFGVNGTKLIKDPIYKDSQDFVLLSHPSFFLNDTKSSAEFFERFDAEKISDFLHIPFDIGLNGTITAAKMLSQHIDNPLFTQYYSVTPYQLGSKDINPHVVRYSVRSCNPNMQVKSDKTSGKNFLRDSMQETLKNKSACMEFMLQDRGALFGVDLNNYDNWDEDKFPFVPIAQIIIPPQTFDTAGNNTMCEKLSYNPWHSIEDHKPLGVINAMRGMVYDKTSNVRRTMNNDN